MGAAERATSLVTLLALQRRVVCFHPIIVGSALEKRTEAWDHCAVLAGRSRACPDALKKQASTSGRNGKCKTRGKDKHMVGPQTLK